MKKAQAWWLLGSLHGEELSWGKISNSSPKEVQEEPITLLNLGGGLRSK